MKICHLLKANDEKLKLHNFRGSEETRKCPKNLWRHQTVPLKLTHTCTKNQALI